jgi:hypothetical protein
MSIGKWRFATIGPRLHLDTVKAVGGAIDDRTAAAIKLVANNQPSTYRADNDARFHKANCAGVAEKPKTKMGAKIICAHPRYLFRPATSLRERHNRVDNDFRIIHVFKVGPQLEYLIKFIVCHDSECEQV